VDVFDEAVVGAFLHEPEAFFHLLSKIRAASGFLDESFRGLLCGILGMRCGPGRLGEAVMQKQITVDMDIRGKQ
jgi:hypothetical protein